MQKVFMLSYLSLLSENSHEIFVQKLVAESGEAALGQLIAHGVHTDEWLVEREDPDTEKWPKPLDPEGVVVIELSVDLAEEIMTLSL